MSFSHFYSSCTSHVGMLGGEQPVYLSKMCRFVSVFLDDGRLRKQLLFASHTDTAINVNLDPLPRDRLVGPFIILFFAEFAFLNCSPRNQSVRVCLLYTSPSPRD